MQVMGSDLWLKSFEDRTYEFFDGALPGFAQTIGGATDSFAPLGLHPPLPLGRFVRDVPVDRVQDVFDRPGMIRKFVRTKPRQIWASGDAPVADMRR